MKLINSLVHSCTHSLASLETLVVVGKHFFMILPTLAMGKKRCRDLGQLTAAEQLNKGQYTHVLLLVGVDLLL